MRQREPNMAEHPRAAQLIGDLERARDAVAELDSPPRVVGDTDLASCKKARSNRNASPFKLRNLRIAGIRAFAGVTLDVQK